MWTPSGEVLLFETYAPYTAVAARSSQLWRGFGGILLTSLLLLLVAQAPLTWALVARVRRAQAEREAWLARAVSASDEERRRIGATLHDGAVQELAASAFLVAGAADRVRAGGDDETARQLDVAAGSVRTSIGGLRSLLVDIYPPCAALVRPADGTAGPRGADAVARRRGDLDVPDNPDLPPPVEALVFRVAQESLRNIARHARASHVAVSLTVPGEEGRVTLEIVDDGVGFDPEAVRDRAARGPLRPAADVRPDRGGRWRRLRGPAGARRRDYAWRARSWPRRSTATAPERT